MLLDFAARVVLMPVLIGQAFYARGRIVQLPEPTGDRSGTCGTGPELRLLILGDSSAVGLGVDTQAQALLGQITQALSPDFTVSYDLVAVTGARTADALGWLANLPAGNYDVIVTAFGVNDVTKGTSLKGFLARQAQLLDQLQSQFGAEIIVVSGLPPVRDFPALPHPLRWVLGRQAIRFDLALRDLVARRAGCTVLKFNLALNASNMGLDGFHPGPSVYAAWAKEVVMAINVHKRLA